MAFTIILIASGFKASKSAYLSVVIWMPQRVTWFSQIEIKKSMPMNLFVNLCQSLDLVVRLTVSQYPQVLRYFNQTIIDRIGQIAPL